MTPDTTLDAFRRAQAFFDADQPAEAARLLDEVVAASPDSFTGEFLREILNGAVIEVQAEAVGAGAAR